jgi:capsular polysaccharide biosynthesis protein
MKVKRSIQHRPAAEAREKSREKSLSGRSGMFFETNVINAPRTHYEGIVYDALFVCWKQRLLVVRVFGAMLAVLLIALIFKAPQYTGEAVIQLDFVRNENIAGEKLQSTAAVDAAAIVDSSARIIRSRGTAGAVVAALALDNDPAYAKLSLSTWALSPIWWVLGQPASSPRDIAISRLMRQIVVTNDPRSYLITVTVTASDPKRAARLANWVASEYLRGRLREQATGDHAAAEREVVGLSAVLGPRHPTYLNGLAKRERLREALDSARNGIAADDREAVLSPDMIRFAAGQSLLPAEIVEAPSGPNVMLLVLLTMLAALAAGILLSLLAERGVLRRIALRSLVFVRGVRGIIPFEIPLWR